MATLIHRMSSADRARHRKLERLLHLQDAALRSHRQALRDGETASVKDAEERSLDAEERSVAFSLLELTSQTVQGIRTALQRLETGAFGTCGECRGRISEARLRSLPFAVLCLVCQEKRDAAASASQAPAGWMERAALQDEALEA